MHARILEGDKVRVTTNPQEVRAALESKQLIWVELERQDEHCDLLLREVLHLHPLTIEDIWNTRHAPKLEDFDHYLYVIIHGVKATRGGAFELVELDVVIGETFVITHDMDGLVATEVAAELDRSPRML